MSLEFKHSVQSKHVHRTNPQLPANIALNINSKLDGINHVIDVGEKSPVFREPVIVFGADVTHPSPTENGIPSIAAVVAIMDANAAKYCARVRESLLLWFRIAIIRDCSVKTKEMNLAKQGMFLLVRQWTAVSHIRTSSTFICAVILESRYFSLNITCRVFTLKMVIGGLIILCQTDPNLSLGTF